MANVASKISYQGVLKESGVPVTGARNMVFRLHSEGTCSGVWIAEVSRPGVQVSHGVFSVELDFPEGAWGGSGRWLEVRVEGTTIDCREILPVPYALGLRPGADIWGDPTAWDGWVLRVNMSSGYPSGKAVLGRAATGSAIYGESDGGNAVKGVTDNGYGVYGYDGGSTYNRGYAGYFESDNGVAVYGSVDTSASGSNSYAPAIWGESDDGVGVYGLSGPAIWKNINRRGGVVGESDALYGVVGVSYDSAGVYGYSDSSYGGHFYTSSTATAVRAESDAGNPIEGWDMNYPAADDRVFYITNNGHCYIDGNYYGGGGVYMGSADFAEMVLPDQEDLVPGDVLVVGPEGRMIRSSEAYEPTVVGVYSTEPGFVGGNKLDEDGDPLEPERIPLAIVGIVPVKASAENGPIQPGDLLAASSTPGHAMRAGADPPVGTIIGKALESLDEGRGLISMLVTLQ